MPPEGEWIIEIHVRARKDFRRLDSQTRGRILDALDALASDPQTATGVKALKGRDSFRLRVGDYRVIYELDDGALIILVLRIGHRKDVYR